MERQVQNILFLKHVNYSIIVQQHNVNLGSNPIRKSAVVFEQLDAYLGIVLIFTRFRFSIHNRCDDVARTQVGNRYGF